MSDKLTFTMIDHTYVEGKFRHTNDIIPYRYDIIKTIPKIINIFKTAFSYDNQYLITSNGVAPWIDIYETTNWTKLPSITTTLITTPRAFCCSPTGLLYAGQSISHSVLYNLNDHTCENLILPSNLGTVSYANFSPDGSQLVVVGNQGIIIFETTDWQVLYSLINSSSPNNNWLFKSAIYSPNGQYLCLASSISATSSTPFEINIIDTGSFVSLYKKQITAQATNNYPFFQGTFSPDNNYVAYWNENIASNRIEIVDLDDFTIHHTISETNRVYSINYTPDGTQLIYNCDGYPSFKVYNTSNWTLVPYINLAFNNLTTNFEFSQNRKWVVANNNSTITIMI